MRKALFAAAGVIALGLSAPAFAQSAGDIENSGDNSYVNGFNETDLSNNSTWDITDSGNDSSDNSTNVDFTLGDSFNNNADNSTNTNVTLDDVGNDNSNTRTSANIHLLTGSVTGVNVQFSAGAGADQSGDLVTGAAEVDTSGSFAGIQNVSANTGVATNVLVSNALSANADISFGGAD
jgi:hypothetical protein